MNLTAVKTWASGETLTASDLNSEFSNIYDHTITNSDLDSTGSYVLGELVVGAGISTADGGQLHVHSGSAGTVQAHADADEAVFENTTASGLTILSGNTSAGNIYFGDDGDNDVGKISYSHSTNALTVTTNGTLALTVSSAQLATFAGAATVTGLTTATGGITSGGNIISDTDSTDDLGTTSVRWANVYADSLGDTGQDLGIAATTVNLPSGFVFDYNAADVTITHSANTLTIAGGTLVGTINPDASSVLANGVTATTQSASDNSTKVATTAYADAAAAASAGTPGGSNTHVQFNNSGAFGGSANLTFDGTNLTATLSATSVLASGVTATTQSASDNSTKVATTAYVETAVAAGGAGAAFSEFLLIGA